MMIMIKSLKTNTVFVCLLKQTNNNSNNTRAVNRLKYLIAINSRLIV